MSPGVYMFRSILSASSSAEFRIVEELLFHQIRRFRLSIITIGQCYSQDSPEIRPYAEVPMAAVEAPAGRHLSATRLLVREVNRAIQVKKMSRMSVIYMDDVRGQSIPVGMLATVQLARLLSRRDWTRHRRCYRYEVNTIGGVKQRSRRRQRRAVTGIVNIRGQTFQTEETRNVHVRQRDCPGEAEHDRRRRHRGTGAGCPAGAH